MTQACPDELHSAVTAHADFSQCEYKVHASRLNKLGDLHATGAQTSSLRERVRLFDQKNDVCLLYLQLLEVVEGVSGNLKGPLNE